MRVRRHSAQMEDAGIDLAPILDFFLNLLIFFIVSAAFVTEAGIRVTRPSAKTAVKEDTSSIFVAVSKTGEVWIDRQHVDIRTLRTHIARMHSQRPKSAVVIQADQDARAGLVVEAMDQARLAGVPNVSVAATPVR